MDSPRDDMQTLPEGIEALRALVLTMMSERDAAVTERDILLAQNDRLRHLLLQLRRMQFGARSERLPEDQLQLGLEALEQAIAKGDAEAEKRDAALQKDNAARRRASRGALPAHLPRIEVTLAPEDTACPCCRATMTVIGEDTSERLDVIPAQFRVIVTRRPKLACRSCTGTVVQAPAVHSAHVGQELEVHYPWHPYFRRKVLVRRVEERATGQFVQVKGPTGIVICIAGWMFDPVACAKLVLGTPCADLTTLLELKQALIGARMPRESPSDSGFVQEGSDEVSRLADGGSWSADDPAARQQPSRRTGGYRAKQSRLGTGADTDAGSGREGRGARR
jgi:hypothetical protein